MKPIPCYQLRHITQKMSDTLTEKQKEIVNAALEGKNMWIVGPPGTGKSYIIAHIRKVLTSKDKIVATTAMTGAAASLINAITIHRFTRTGNNSLKMHLANFSDYAEELDQAQKKQLQEVNVLILDEAGMMGDSAAHHLDRFFRKVRGNCNKPYGGMQVIMVGDIAQLPPTAAKKGAGEDRDELIQQDSVFAFQDDGFKVYVLSEFMRSAEDPLLQQITLAQYDKDPKIRKLAARLLNEKCFNEEKVGHVYTNLNYAVSKGALIVTPTNKWVEKYIQMEEIQLKDSGIIPVKIPEPTKLYSYETLTAENISYLGGVNGVEREDREIVERGTFKFGLKLYPGQQVRISQNGSWNNIQYQNGNLCVFLEYNKEDDYILVCRNRDNQKIRIFAMEHKSEYEAEAGKIGYKAFPIMPAIAGNVHRVQGMTVSSVLFDPYGIQWFKKDVPRLLFVATSRVKLLSNFYLAYQIEENLLVNTDVQKALENMWEFDYMKEYPRANFEKLKQYCIELGIDYN